MEQSIELLITLVALDLILSVICFVFLYFATPKTSGQTIVSVRYFSFFYLMMLVGFISFVVRDYLNETFSIALTNTAYLIAFYCIYHGLLWRSGKKLHLHQNRYFYLNLIVFLLIQTVVFSLLYTSMFARNVMLLIQLAMIFTLSAKIISAGKTELTLGERSARYALAIPAYLALAAALSTLIYDGRELFMTTLVIESAIIVIVFGGLTSLLTSDQAEQYRISSITDPLTGLYNRRYFIEQAHMQLKSAQRHHFPMSVFIVDLDLFKQINDKYGHDIGDQTIIEFSKVLKQAVREVDIAARFGGEEFVGLLPQTDLGGATHVAERIRVATENICINTEQGPLSITASFGISSFNDAHEIEENLKRADKALYVAKQNGRNQVRTYQTEQVQEMEDISI